MEHKLRYELDADDRFLGASATWNRFAASNEAPELTVQNIRGRSLYDFIADRETKELQRMILVQARQSRRPLEYTIRCDSPTHLRLLQLVVTSPDGAKVCTTSRVLRFEPQDSGLLLARAADRRGDLLRICSWCRRVRCAHGWLDPAEAAEALGLFVSMPVPRLTHGICEDCYETMKGVVND